MKNQALKVGDKIRLMPIVIKSNVLGRENHPDAIIVSFLEEGEGDVCLDRDLGFSRYWNVTDLEHADE